MQASATTEAPIRVMLVDDHKAILWGLERLIQSAGSAMHLVGTATNRADMLRAAAEMKPDVIVLDLDLNGDDASNSIVEIQQRCAAQVVILTGGRDPEVHQAAILNGAKGVVGKDESADHLLRAIESVHAGEVWINRSMMSRILGSVTGAASATDKVRNPEAGKIASLTPREREIIQSVLRNRGAKGEVIAESLHISEHTLRNHLTVIYDKLGLRNRLDLFAFATEHRIG